VVRVGIIGVSGYGGGELLRILSGHPRVKITYLTSETYKGRDIGIALPNMLGVVELECETYSREMAVERCDVVFLARDKGWAMKESPYLLEKGLKVVDLSADFRLKDPAVYEEWYKIPHESADLLTEAVFGLPEIHRREIPDARLIANPGCYVTGGLLALAPLLSNKLIETDSIIVDSLSGVSGAGRSSYKLDYHFPELNENMKAYNVGSHRHTPEIEQELSAIAGSPVLISFTPHLIPVTRGILTTAYARFNDCCLSTERVLEIYREYYKSSRFVIVLDDGDLPVTKSVTGSNFCHIGAKVDTRTNRVIVISAIDNLVKGMAGQAVQNLNLMSKFDEDTGLIRAGMWP
jgi:N-acetyl-gamma-glutamyl-phosphate reductase